MKLGRDLSLTTSWLLSKATGGLFTTMLIHYRLQDKKPIRKKANWIKSLLDKKLTTGQKAFYIWGRYPPKCRVWRQIWPAVTNNTEGSKFAGLIAYFTFPNYWKRDINWDQAPGACMYETAAYQHIAYQLSAYICLYPCMIYTAHDQEKQNCMMHMRYRRYDFWLLMWAVNIFLLSAHQRGVAGIERRREK